MPLVRYFVLTGGILLGLLFIAGWYFPPSAGTLAANNIDRSIIRIHSSHKWPAAIQIDTSAPMPSAAAVAADAATISARVDRVRQTYAFDASRPQAAPERVSRRAKPARPASRQNGQYFVNYQPWDSRNW
jgi:hypothetical protein